MANEVGMQRTLFGQLQRRLEEQENKYDKQMQEMTTKMDDLQNKMLGQENYVRQRDVQMLSISDAQSI
eukprot:2004803-Karenia_brevis.AAC.1